MSEGPTRVQQSVRRIRVGVITDWRRRQRSCAWKEVLQETELDLEVREYPIADLIISHHPVDVAKLKTIDQEDVLILNWDVANGDPEFGAHLCQRWLDHRRPEIIDWVRRGNILLIESQATLGVPCQAAYDAAVGRNELPTSVASDSKNPALLTKCGLAAEKTTRFPTGGGFEKVGELRIREHSYSLGLPDDMSGLLRASLGTAGVSATAQLYRGWFRRTSRFRTWLNWVSIIETPGPRWSRQAVLKVARVEAGAIFASTMILSGSRQVALIRAILRCVDETGHLPDPPGIVTFGQRYIRAGITPFVGLISTFLLVRFSDALSWFTQIVPLKPKENSIQFAILKVVIGIALLISITMLFKQLYRSYRWCVSTVQRFLGY